MPVHPALHDVKTSGTLRRDFLRRVVRRDFMSRHRPHRHPVLPLDLKRQRPVHVRVDKMKQDRSVFFHACRDVCLAPAADIDRILSAVFPEQPHDMTDGLQIGLSASVGRGYQDRVHLPAVTEEIRHRRNVQDITVPENDVEITAKAGDIVLYSGNSIVVFYGSNSWAYTRLGRITNLTDAELTQLLSNGDVTITISMEE